jgi:hypothetical protein
MPDAEAARCPECGAPLIDRADCRAMLGLVCAWEVDDPDLAAAHFLTVAAWNLQHPAAFTVEAIAGLRSLFIDALECDLPAAELRRRAGRMAAGARRVRRDPADCHPMLRRWDMTIADVYAPSPADAAERVRAWANALRREL